MGLTAGKGGFVAPESGHTDCVDNRDMPMEIAALLALHTTSTMHAVFSELTRAGHAARPSILCLVRRINDMGCQVQSRPAGRLTQNLRT